MYSGAIVLGASARGPVGAQLNYAGERWHPPTPRQLECARLAAHGKSNREIADELGISCQTVKNHMSDLLRRLKATDRAHAVYLLMKQKLID